MKQVILVTENAHGADFVTDFDTIKEAQNQAEESAYEEFEIYTRYMKGERAKIDWKLESDTVTNLREAEKTKPKKEKTFRKWTYLEEQTLLNSVRNKKKIHEIAKLLDRTPHACDCKLSAIRKKMKKQTEDI